MYIKLIFEVGQFSMHINYPTIHTYNSYLCNESEITSFPNPLFELIWVNRPEMFYR